MLFRDDSLNIMLALALKHILKYQTLQSQQKDQPTHSNHSLSETSTKRQCLIRKPGALWSMTQSFTMKTISEIKQKPHKNIVS